MPFLLHAVFRLPDLEVVVFRAARTGPRSSFVFRATLGPRPRLGRTGRARFVVVRSVVFGQRHQLGLQSGERLSRVVAETSTVRLLLLASWLAAIENETNSQSLLVFFLTKIIYYS